MAWVELKLTIQSDVLPLVSNTLETNGALAVTLQDAKDQPIYEPNIDHPPPVWDEVVISGLFDEVVNIKKIIDLVLMDCPNAISEIKHIADQEWERAWMQDFVPMQFGDRLWIIPSYQTQSQSPFHIILDPGLAFGTGKHPTTALCLRWLDKNIKGQETVIDYGCGSGILSIACLKLGTSHVYAVDHDPQAISATQENALRNQITVDHLTTCLPNELSIKQPVDLLVANILANPLIELAGTFRELVRAGGDLVLSGILEEQAADVIEAYHSMFTVLDVAQQEEWVRIHFVKK